MGHTLSFLSTERTKRYTITSDHNEIVFMDKECARNESSADYLVRMEVLPEAAMTVQRQEDDCLMCGS